MQEFYIEIQQYLWNVYGLLEVVHFCLLYEWLGLRLNIEMSEKHKFKTGVEVLWDARIGPFMDQQNYRLLGIDMAENRNSPCNGSR